MSADQVIQRLQDLETVVVKRLDRPLSKVQNGIALCWTTVTTTVGQVVDTRVLGKVDKWNSSGINLTLKLTLVLGFLDRHEHHQFIELDQRFAAALSLSALTRCLRISNT